MKISSNAYVGRGSEVGITEQTYNEAPKRFERRCCLFETYIYTGFDHGMGGALTPA